MKEVAGVGTEEEVQLDKLILSFYSVPGMGKERFRPVHWVSQASDGG